MSRSYDLPEADWVAVGVVGEPGSRTFYLQGGQGDEIVTLKVEKTQVGALAGFITDMMADLPETSRFDFEGSDAGTLREPLDVAWTVGAIQLRYDNVSDRIVLLAEELTDAATGGSDVERAVATIGMSRAQAAAFVAAGSDLVTSGRPLCPLCGRPINPEGHSCPRTNGHHPA
ncbi:MAG: DUF3090 family protein [Acidimicrobiales bacterium]